MPLLYALVARGTVVLAEFSVTSGNAGAIARKILEKLPPTGDTHVSYAQERHIFHILKADGITYLCMANEMFGRRLPFAFLEDIRLRFSKAYGNTGLTALQYAMNDEFSRVLAQQMEYYSNNPNADAISRMKGEINEVKNVMVENIDKVLERGDRLELLVTKTDSLQGETFRFKKSSRRLQRAMWLKNAKLMLAMGGTITAVVYVALSSVCGGLELPYCR